MRYGTKPQPMVIGNMSKDAMYGEAKNLTEMAKNLAAVDRSYNFFLNPLALMEANVQAKLKQNFVDDMIEGDKKYRGEKYSVDDEMELREDYEQLFENDMEGMIGAAASLTEATAISAINPVIATALPMHKNLLMNNVFDKGAIPKAVANHFSFNRTMEIRWLVAPDGNKIDMYKEQNKMTDVLLNTNKEVFIDVSLPENYTTDIITALNGAVGVDHLDRTTRIAGVAVANVLIKAGEALPDETDGWFGEGPIAETETVKDIVWFRVDLKYAATLGQLNRGLQEPIRPFSYTEKIGEGPATVVNIGENAYISSNIVEDKISILTSSPKIVKARIGATLDASMRTLTPPTVEWGDFTTNVEIGTDTGIAARISPESVKDIAVGYNVNQVTKLMSLMKIALANRKDDTILRDLNANYKEMDPAARFYGDFDFAPIKSYQGDPVTWRHATFFDWLNDYSQRMIQYLNDPNMSFSIFCNPNLVDKLGPLEVSFTSPANVGAVQLDFTKTIVTPSNHKVYQFVGSDKLRKNDEMIAITCPKGTDRVTYIIYDYQFYLSNEIRSNNNPALPQITSFERYKFDHYQPVQGRITIKHPTGYAEDSGSLTTTPTNAAGTL